MTREDLFLAIGEASESRLARSEWTAVSPSHETQMEGQNMKKTISFKRVIRNVLVAALIVSMLATTAFAVGGYVLYDNPVAMLNAFFGEQLELHGPDCNCSDCRAKREAPTVEREPVNMEVAEQEVVPYLNAIGDSFVYEEYPTKFTVDAHTYDSVTGCGLIYYTMEHVGKLAEYPIDYDLNEFGEIISGIGSHVEIPSHEYLVQEESTPTKLKIALYYIRPLRTQEDTALKFAHGEKIYDDETGELIGENEDYILYLPYEDNGGMKSLSLADGSIVVSPIGLVYYNDILPEYRSEFTGEIKVKRLAIQYADGTEYVVMDNGGNGVMNYVQWLLETMPGEDEQTGMKKSTLCLNRIVDIDNVTAVVINDVTFPAA